MEAIIHRPSNSLILLAGAGKKGVTLLPTGLLRVAENVGMYTQFPLHESFAVPSGALPPGVLFRLFRYGLRCWPFGSRGRGPRVFAGGRVSGRGDDRGGADADSAAAVASGATEGGSWSLRDRGMLKQALGPGRAREV